MPETLTTSEQIIQYFNYISGGYASVAAGYPGAFGFLTPGLTNSVYLAPNTSFDFSLVEYQKLGAEGAAAAWAQEWNQLAIGIFAFATVVWPWHDYGPTAWGVTSPYTTQMFTDWIQRAYLAGDEFVTAADLASRIQSFAQSDVTSTVNGNVITVSVASAHAGAFALNVAGQGTQVIQNVANWYAYDNDSLFLPEIGGNYTITLGTAADDVTHITALPMRGDLLSVTGDRLNLSFSMIGEGDVFIDLGLGSATSTPIVTGATIVSRVGDLLDLKLTGLGQHDVSLLMTVPLPTEVVSTLLFSADTGSSAIDFVTNTAAQTILGTLSAALGLGDVVQLSLDNGATWLAATATAGTATFSLPGVTLTASGTLMARVMNSAGRAGGALFTQPYVLDQMPPTDTANIATMTGDSGVAGDFITNNGLAGRTVSGTISSSLPTGTTLQLSFDGGANWAAATVTGTARSAIDSASHTANWSIQTQVVDLAGNAGPTSSRSVTLDTTPPSASLAIASTSDSGLSSTDSITKVTRPIFTGVTEAGSTVVLFDGTSQIGTGVATATGQWSISTVAALANGIHNVTARVTDVAGNSVTPTPLSVLIDTVIPTASTVPDMLAASDSGTSPTDNLTRIATPTFSGSAEAGSTVTLFDGATAIGTGIAAAGSWSITTSNLTDGTHSITAKTTDVAGNVSAASGALSVKIDTKAPLQSSPDLIATSDTGVSSTDNVTKTTTPTFTGTAEVGSAVKLLDGSTQIGSATASASGGWTITAPVLGQGTHAIATTATDAAGNTSAPSAALSVNIDTTAPSSPAFNGLTANSNFSATLAGTAEASSIVTVFDLSTQLGTATAGGTGVWSFKTGALSDTLHVFTASATDQAGTAGGISGSAQFGSSAADIFTSASGNDTLMGRGGADTFSFMANFANDIISDFAATGAGHDVINFHANAVLNNYTSVLSHAAQSGSSVMISQDVGNTLILRNVTLGSLNTSAFTFV